MPTDAIFSSRSESRPPSASPHARCSRAEVLPSRNLNNGLERDHSHLKQRLYPMRGFKRGTSADTLARGHALIRNLRGGFSSLTADVAPNLRLASAWPQLTQAI